MKKRVLVITYYWPPSGGAGVQRWLKFAKYLPQNGWQPVIYTPENPEIPVVDDSLVKDIPSEAEIVRTRIWEPYEWYKLFTGRRGERINTGFLNEKGKGGATEKISVWLRGNLFIPDARKFWIKPSIKYLLEYLEKNPVDAIVSSGPPHSMHLIALGLKKKLNVKWVADFRDPWTNIDFYHELRLTKHSDKKHRSLEKEVLKYADEVITIGKTLSEEMAAIGSRKVNVITNGYDASDLQNDAVDTDMKFSISHIGTLSKSRNPVQLWKALAELVKEEKLFADSLEIKLAGKVDFHIKQSLNECGLEKHVHYIDYIPHDEVAKLQQQSQVLLLILNDTPNAKGILTGKLFEYMAALRPILCIGRRDGDAAVIINETKCGEVCEYADHEKMKETVKKYFNRYKEGTLASSAQFIEQYSRAALTKDLVTLLNKN